MPKIFRTLVLLLFLPFAFESSAADLPRIWIEDGRVKETQSGQLNIFLSEPSTNRVTFLVKLAFASASYPAAFQFTAPTSIPAGATNAVLKISTYRDNGEVDKYVTFYLTNVVGAVVEKTQGTMVILDDPHSLIWFDQPPPIKVGASNLTLRVPIMCQAGATLSYFTVEGSAQANIDFRPASGTLSFTDGEISVLLLGGVRRYEERSFQIILLDAFPSTLTDDAIIVRLSPRISPDILSLNLTVAGGEVIFSSEEDGRYYLESKSDIEGPWISGEPFLGHNGSTTVQVDVNQSQRFFRIREEP